MTNPIKHFINIDSIPADTLHQIMKSGASFKEKQIYATPNIPRAFAGHDI